MDYEFESIIPWNGEHDTGRDARLKLDRNFAKIKSNFEELAGSRYVTTDFFARLFAPEGEDGAEVDANDMEAVITAVRVKFGLYTDSYISAKGKNPEAGGEVSGVTELSKLADVALTEQQDGQVLAWDAAKQKWVNKTSEAGLDETALAQYLVNNNYVTQSWLEEQKYATQQWVTKTLEQYVTAEDMGKAVAEAVSAALAGKVDTTFFARLLAAIAGDGTEISVNDMETAIASVKVKFGLWGDSWISAKGQNPDAGSSASGATDLDGLTDVTLTSPQNGQVLAYNGSQWVNKTLEAGLDETALAQYLTDNLYVTQTWVNSQNYATVADLDARIDALVNGAPAAFDTLKEIADVLQGNVDSIGDILMALAGKADKTITITAGAGLTGGGDLSANRTMALATVGTAGTYTKVTVDAYGRVTGHSSLTAGDIPSLSISKITGLQSALDAKLDAATFNDLFEKVEISTGVYAIRAKYGLYSNDWISAKGANPDAGGTVAGASSLEELSDVSLSGLQDGQVLAYDTATQKWVNKSVSSGGMDEDALAEYLTTNQYAKKRDIPSLAGYATQAWVNTQLGSYATTSSMNSALGNKADKTITITAGTGLTGGGDLSANRTLSLATVGTAGTYTKVTVDAYGRVTGHASLAAVDIPNLPWSKITSGKPTTLAGYGITDAYTKTESEGRYVKKSGDTMTGALTVNTGTGTRIVLGSGIQLWANAAGGWARNFAVYNSSGESALTNGSIAGAYGSGNTLHYTYYGGTYNSPAMVILPSNKYVGIGTTSPSYKLHVVGGIYSSEYIQIGSGRIKWDSSNNALYVEKSDGTAIGFYSKGFISAKGANDDAGGSASGVTALSQLSDVSLGTLANGQALVWNGSQWVNKTIEGGLDETALAEYLTDNGYATQTWATSQFANKTGTNASGTWPISINGNASTSSKWATARTLTLTGDVTGSVSMDGSANVSLATEVSDNVFTYRGQVTASGSNPTASELTTATLQGTYKVQYSGASGKLIVFRSTGGSADYTQIYHNFNANLMWRSSTDKTLSGKPWRTLLDTNNYTSYLDSRYVNASGDTMTGALTVNSTVTASGQIQGGSFKLGSGTITWDSTNNCFHFSHGLYSDSFVSAKGANSGSGGTVSGVTKLSDLSDVQLGTLATNQVLSWNGSKWVNKAISTGLDETALAQYLTSNGYATQTWVTARGYLTSVSLATISDLHSSWDSVLKAQKPAWLTSVSLATISDLHASWDALLKAAPSVYVTRWPTAAEVGALTQTTADGRYVRDNNASGTTDTNSALSNAVTHNYRWSNAPYNDISSLFDFTYSEDWRTQLFVKHQASTDIRVRSRYNGTTWGSWRTIAFTDSNVYSATKLQTARTINGTSFNGTANITTSKWGTARSIYIRDASQAHTGSAVSVDGSANEYLLLPSTITATLSGNASTSSKWATARTLTLTGDVTSSVSMDGSKNVSLATEVSDNVFTYRGRVTASGPNPTASELTDATLQGTYNVLYSGAIGKLIVFRALDSSAVYTQIYHTYAGSMMWRSSQDSTLSGKAWRTLLDTNNYTSYLDSRYVNTSGDTMTGSLTVNTGTGTRIVLGSGIQLWANPNSGWARSLAAYNTSGSAALENGNICGAYGTANTLYYMYYGGTYDSPAMVILPSNKYVGIGTTSPNYKLHVAGVAYASTGLFSDGYVSAKGQNSSSDLRLKTILCPVRPSLEAFAKAPLFKFAWKSDPGMVEIGSSAQYWKNVLPDTVKERDGWLEMGYGNIALAGVITIARDFETLEQRVDRLEKENGKLKKRIKELERRAA